MQLCIIKMYITFDHIPFWFIQCLTNIPHTKKNVPTFVGLWQKWRQFRLTQNKTTSVVDRLACFPDIIELLATIGTWYLRGFREGTPCLGLDDTEWDASLSEGCTPSWAGVELSVPRAHSEIFAKSYYINPKSDCIYHFPIDLEPNGRPFGSKSTGKWEVQSDFGLI